MIEDREYSIYMPQMSLKEVTYISCPEMLFKLGVSVGQLRSVLRCWSVKSKWISVELLLLSAHFVEIVEEEVLTFETFL
jgi:hypothetical protein